jgi:Predicted acyltransferase
MKRLVKGKILNYDDDLTEAFEIRKQVFIDELRIPPQNEFDEEDYMAVHALVYNEQFDEPVATGRVAFDGEHYRIEHVAVLKNERKKGYGDFIVRILINKAIMAGAQEIYIDAFKITVPFYEKIGFQVVGEEFVKSGICYVPMKIINGNLCKKCINIPNYE